MDFKVEAGEDLQIGQPVVLHVEFPCVNCNGQTDEDNFCVRCGREPIDCPCVELPKTPTMKAMGLPTLKYKDSRGFTEFFACNCREHAYHSNCKNCGCELY
jgi:hypothetical protein